MHPPQSTAVGLSFSAKSVIKSMIMRMRFFPRPSADQTMSYRYNFLKVNLGNGHNDKLSSLFSKTIWAKIEIKDDSWSPLPLV